MTTYEVDDKKSIMQYTSNHDSQAEEEKNHSVIDNYNWINKYHLRAKFESSIEAIIYTCNSEHAR